MNRRTFLKGTTAAVGTAGVAAGYLGLKTSTALPEPTGPLHVLEPVGFGVLAVFAGRILPFDAADPVATAHGVDASLRYATPEAQADLSLVLSVLENALSGLLTRGRATLFSELSPEARDAAIRRWGNGSVGMLRGATNALRKLCLGVHYAPLEHAAATGYPGPPIAVPSPPPIAARRPLSPPWQLAAFGDREEPR